MGTEAESRSVRFASEDDVQEIEHVNEITNDERLVRWFSKKEFSIIRLQYNLIAKKMNNSVCIFSSNEDDEIIVEQYDENGIITQPCDTFDESNPTRKDCTRGLEHKTREGSRRRAFNKQNALDTVLLEQQRQILRCHTGNSSSNSGALGNECHDNVIMMDDNAISDVYMSETKAPMEAALVLAAKDARFAEKYAREPITSSTSSPHTMAALNNTIEHFFSNTISDIASSNNEKQQDD